VSLKNSPIAAPAIAEYTCIGTGSDALAATITVYAKAPLSESVLTICATVEAF
jgi:hypothetical protein